MESEKFCEKPGALAIPKAIAYAHLKLPLHLPPNWSIKP